MGVGFIGFRECCGLAFQDLLPGSPTPTRQLMRGQSVGPVSSLGDLAERHTGLVRRLAQEACSRLAQSQTDSSDAGRIVGEPCNGVPSESSSSDGRVRSLSSVLYDASIDLNCSGHELLLTRSMQAELSDSKKRPRGLLKDGLANKLRKGVSSKLNKCKKKTKTQRKKGTAKARARKAAAPRVVAEEALARHDSLSASSDEAMYMEEMQSALLSLQAEKGQQVSGGRYGKVEANLKAKLIPHIFRCPG